MEYYAKQFKNIKIVYNDTRLFPGGSRNVGLNLANGDFIYFLDSDDFIHNKAIETLVREALFYDVPIVSAKFQTVIGPIKLRKSESGQVNLIDLRKSKEKIDDFTDVIWNNLFRHSLIKNFKFPEGLFYEDNAFIHPILTKANFLVEIEQILYFYRRNTSSITIKSKLFPNQRILDVYDIIQVMKKACVELGTYEDYEDVITKIIERIAIAPILECTLWFGMNSQDKKEVLAHLLQYIKKAYGINDIKEVEFLMKRANNPKLNFKLNCLLHLISNLPTVNSQNNIDCAKKILKKYERRSN